MTSDSASDLNPRLSAIALFLICVISFWLRIRYLGSLSLYTDEDIIFLAVKGILETGFPVMPSGMFYPRGLVFTYLAAFSSTLFGLSEFSIRLPSVIFSVLSIILLYKLASEIHSRRVALTVSALICVSAWDIEMARYARMYEGLVFLTLATTFLFYKGFFAGSRLYRILTPIALIVTTATHTLGIFTNALFLLPFIIKGYDVVSRKTVLAYAIAAVAFSYPQTILHGKIYDRTLSPTVLSQPTDAAPLPDLTLISTMLKDFTLSDLSFVIMLLGACLWLGFRIAKCTPVSRLVIVVSILIAMAVLVQQFGIAFWMFVFAIFVNRQGLMGILNGPLRSVAIFLATTFLVWFAYGWLNINESTDNVIGATKEIVLIMLDYPFMNARIFLALMPVVTLLGLAGMALIYDKSSRDARYSKELLVVTGFLVPAVGVGVFKEWPYIGYLYMAYPFLLWAYALVVVESTSRIMQWFATRIQYKRGIALASAAASVVLAISLASHHSLVEAKAIGERTYATDVIDVEIFEYTKHPDHKTPALFIRSKLQPDDLIIAIDSLMAYIYVGRVDYLLRTEGVLAGGLHVDKEPFLGTPTIRNLESLNNVIRTSGAERVWLLTSSEFMGPHLDKPILSDEVVHFLEANRQRTAYIGQDEITRVYMWDQQ